MTTSACGTDDPFAACVSRVATNGRATICNVCIAEPKSWCIEARCYARNRGMRVTYCERGGRIRRGGRSYLEGARCVSYPGLWLVGLLDVAVRGEDRFVTQAGLSPEVLLRL